MSDRAAAQRYIDRKSTRLNSSHLVISYAVFCLKKNKRRERYARGYPTHACSTRVRGRRRVRYALCAQHTLEGRRPIYSGLVFFFNDTATTEIYTLSLHDALPI